MGKMDEGSAPNIQNEFFNQVRREKTRVAVFLNSGRKLTGRIKSFDKFTILIETSHGEQIVFKHAIATVGPNVVTASSRQAPARQASSRPAPSRQKSGFNNRMNLTAASKEVRPESTDAAAESAPAPAESAPPVAEAAPAAKSGAE